MWGGPMRHPLRWMRKHIHTGEVADRPDGPVTSRLIDDLEGDFEMAKTRRTGGVLKPPDCLRRIHLKVAASTVIAVLALILPAVPAEGEDGEDWQTRKHGIAGWEDMSRRWVEVGMVPSGFYLFDILGNPVGGRELATEYAGTAQIDLSLNLEKLLGIRGLAFDAAASWSSGHNLSQSIGNVFQVAAAYTGQTVQLSRLYLEQTLAAGKVHLKLGRVAAGNDFAALPIASYHVNSAINGVPASIPINDPGFFTDPVAQWGLRLRIRPSAFWTLKLGAFNSDPTVADESNHGLDFSFNPEDGVLAAAEIALNPTFGGGRFRGHYRIGAYYDSADFDLLADPLRTQNGQYGYYFTAQQEVYHEDDDPAAVEVRPLFGRHIIRTPVPEGMPLVYQGLMSWFAVALSPREEISTIPVYIAGGVLYRGLFKYRDRDRAGLAVYYGKFSEFLPEKSAETVIELNYAIQMAPWFYITPDVQYVINPGGTDIPNALVIGFETGVTF